ncbi:hypothetical protein EWM64_g5446 [Hericium alpestre]|uniref:Kinetochore protein Spc24 n=1 Tax=Hericium alpestre TaxID=135208 RepID=A0A4Y9ZUL9_9AGAM|nr:hypothetical protein EWM64_g5446 [Hericium alpestre]
MRNMGPVIDPEEDYLTIAAAEEQMAVRAASRRKELEEAHANLKALAKIFDSARVSSTRPHTVPSAEQHGDNLNQLDATRLSLMKAVNDVESALSSKESELARLKEEVRMLEGKDPAAEHDMDGAAIRLQIYKSMGLQPVLDKKLKAEEIIIKGQSGDIHVVRMDEGRSSSETPDMLWKLAAS